MNPQRDLFTETAETKETPETIEARDTMPAATPAAEREDALRPLDVFHCPLDGLRLIEASAGTGKTWNICGLYLRLLLERGFDVSQVLVVTFTNAATAELRERIRQRLLDTWLHVQGRGPATADTFVPRLLDALRGRGLPDEVLAKRLQWALAGFDEAAIFTIHGFCQRALADTPFTARVPMRAELLQDDRELLLEAVQDFWRLRVEDLPPALAAYLLTRRDSPARWAALLKRHLAKPLAEVRWPEGLEEAQELDVAELERTHAAARQAWGATRAEVVGLLEGARPRLHATHYKPQALAQAIASWDAWMAYDSATDALDEDFRKLELLTVAKLRACTKARQTTPEHPFFDVAEAAHRALVRTRSALAYARLALLREMIGHCTETLKALKQRRRVIAFDDMLSNLHARLHGPDGPVLASTLRARFPAALIDEFQDTDPLQFAIFHRLYATPERRPLFLVGDPKQAIYRFRNADLHTYLAARRHADAQYTLEANQRSSAPLVRALNALFGENPRLFMLEGLHYHAVTVGDKPRPALHDGGPARAPLQVWWLPHQEDGSLLEWRAAERLVTQRVASEIARLLASARRGEVRIGERPLGAGDIAVLVRSHAEGSRMRRALAALGVGSVELSQSSVFASAEAEELDALLGAMLEPGREGRLKAALATTLMGRDAGALEALANDEEAMIEQVQRFEDYRRAWLARGVGPMLREWMAREGVAERLLGCPDGERRMTNLLHLIECLQQASSQHPNPDALLRWLQVQRHDPRPDEATQVRLESDRHLVQIVTIHRSKGLEYGIVFCPFLWKSRCAPSASGDAVEYHEQGRTVIDYRKGLDPAFDDQEIRRIQRLEEASEFLRLLYVALTRAVHRCVVVAGCYLARSGQALKPTESARGLLNWVVAGAGIGPEEWLDGEREIDSIRTDWEEWARKAAPHVGFEVLPAITAGPLPAEAAEPAAIAALPAPGHLPSPWWIGSYSALVHGAAHEAAALERDQRAADDEGADAASEPAVELDEDDPLRFPRGAAAGECMHTVFELADFADRGTWASAIATGLRRLRGAEHHGEEHAAGVQTRMLERLLAQVLHSELPLGPTRALRLADLPAGSRVHEMEFYLPAPRLEPARLQRRLQAAGYPVPALSAHALQGYLRGFIDMVFEHEGRYYVLDWKSNHLGESPSGYRRDRLAAVMAREGYHLQALLYLVALHRHLALRLPGYDAAQHLGGALYLFVRGVRPDWRDAEGRPAGVYLDRPGAALIEDLSRLLDAEGGPA